MITKSKIENSTLKMRWAKLPTFEKKYQEATNDALVSFVDYIPSGIFEKVKPYWQGYIDYEGKKTAIYKIDIIEFLLSQTYNIDIDGTIYVKSVKDYPGSLTINKLLNLCKESDIDDIQKMAKKQRSILIFSQIKTELWNLFHPAEVVEIMKDKASNFEWIDVKATENENLYSFDLTNGYLYYETTRWFSNEKTTVARLAKLKVLEDNVKLFKLVVEYKKYGKIITELMNEEFLSRWVEGFDEKSYAPKGKRINTNQKEEEKFVKKEVIEKEMKSVVFEIEEETEKVIKEREEAFKKQTINFTNYIAKTMMEKRDEIDESFEKVSIITDEATFEDEYLEELKSLDNLELEDFLNS